MLLADLEQAILALGPETVCLVHMEPVQNAGGAFTPPEGYWRGVRELCDRYDILLSADEVITALRPARALVRLGALRHPSRHRLLRQGLSSSYAAIGAVIATDRVMEPFLEGASMYAHGITFGGHPGDVRDRAQEHRDHEARADHGAACSRTRTPSARRWSSCSTCRSSATCAARATSTRSSCQEQETREAFSAEECETLLRGFLSPALFERGLICRADDRGDPVIQISPPLVAGQAEFDEIVGILGDVLEEAGNRMVTESATA